MTSGFVVNSQRGAPIERRREASSRPVDEHQLLALQRRLGNQAVLRLLQAQGTVVARAPAPTVLGERSVSQQDLNWLTDAQQWAASVRQGGEEYLKCYAEIATLLQADKVEDVKGTAVGDINGALRAGFAELRPGLNWVRNLGSRGRTGYLYDGKWTSTLPDTATGDAPKVAVVLSANAFDPDNKAFTLGVLRHELEHAVHNRMAADWLMRWRGDAKARRQPFASWLRRQAIGPADRALVEERLAGGISSTEALANLEGFMAAFATEAPGLSLADAPAEEELKDAANFWLTADERVQEEVRARLTAYGARLTGDTRTRFLDTLERLEAENPRWKRLFDPVISAGRRVRLSPAARTRRASW